MSIPIKHALQTRTHICKKKTSFTTASSMMSTYSSSLIKPCSRSKSEQKLRTHIRDSM